MAIKNKWHVKDIYEQSWAERTQIACVQQSQQCKIYGSIIKDQKKVWGNESNYDTGMVRIGVKCFFLFFKNVVVINLL